METGLAPPGPKSVSIRLAKSMFAFSLLLMRCCLNGFARLVSGVRQWVEMGSQESSEAVFVTRPWFSRRARNVFASHTNSGVLSSSSGELGASLPLVADVFGNIAGKCRDIPDPADDELIALLANRSGIAIGNPLRRMLADDWLPEGSSLLEKFRSVADIPRFTSRAMASGRKLVCHQVLSRPALGMPSVVDRSLLSTA